MLKIRYSIRFKKDYKAIVKRGYDVKLLEEVLNILVQEKTLPQKYLDHPLAGNYGGHRECHISPDWLLIYKIEKDILTLSFTLHTKGMLQKHPLPKPQPPGAIVKLFRILWSFPSVVPPVIFLHVLGAKPVLR